MQEKTPVRHTQHDHAIPTRSPGYRVPTHPDTPIPHARPLYRVYIFDLDDTLRDTRTNLPFPGVECILRHLQACREDYEGSQCGERSPHRGPGCPLSSS